MQPLDRAIYSSPAVANGRVFVGTYSYDQHAGSIMAFDAATGEQQWVHETGRIHASAPSVGDGTLYINSGGLDNPDLVHAVDMASGAVQWTHEFAGGERIRSSPTVADGVVYASAEIGTDVQGETDVAVHALDADTGELLWSATINHAALEYSSPAVVDGTVYHHVVDECDGDTGLYAFDATTGETEWAVQAGSMTGSPTVVDGTLYHSTAGLHGGGVARDAATGEILWETARGRDATFGPAVADGTVYGTTADSGSAFALDVASGDLQWEFDSGEARGSPVVDADTVYVPSWGEERIYALDAADGTERWHVDLESRPYQPPAVVDGTLFVGDAARRGGLYAIAGQ
ncbi:PQQ-binding-like beta-propeller repeat protein [Halorarius litoreus]|uniref:outer membrane protein assembly factor BamB family protein n=1 Tax=Halorarius litoreus TaxID=2962676 RepID=UPI0020CF8CE6|nr:PQQ-binding-like beta-propeller repeat protein [Halorarius litoreus]